jgi:hypothetical protein
MPIRSVEDCLRLSTGALRGSGQHLRRRPPFVAPYARGVLQTPVGSEYSGTGFQPAMGQVLCNVSV